ncbi:hypothetical protein CDD83_1468 [Cordyceps sp. RAO-2017]|nr:hypothetical protein CDD83_1468 [Cordyceps sp. RAO-2017]
MNSPPANAGNPSTAYRRLGSPADTLVLDTSRLVEAESPVPRLASGLSSARLTPSPHCSPIVPPRVRPSAVGSSASAEAGRPQPPAAEADHPFGRYRYPGAAAALEASLSAGWAGVRQGPATWPQTLGPVASDVPVSRWASVQAGQAFVPSGSTSSTSSNRRNSSSSSNASLGSSGFRLPLHQQHQQQRQQQRQQLDEGANSADLEASLRRAGQAGPSFAHPHQQQQHPFARAPAGRPSPLSFGGPAAGAAEVQARDGGFWLANAAAAGGHGVSAGQGGVGNEAFDTGRLQAALPAVVRQGAGGRQQQQGQHGGFLPMMAVAEPERRRNSLAAMQVNASDSAKFSSRYHGMHTDSNASADIPPEKNCALWLTNLPADIRYPELLASIRNVGRIWCTYVNLPDNIKHHTAAAKVVFFTPQGAQKLLAESWNQTIVIRGYRVRASHNRIKYEENAVVGKTSRVLIITGRQGFVNADNLRKWFSERFVYQEDAVIELIKAAGRAVCEFRFGSYRCQSQMGKMALEKDRPVGFEKVEFGDDPCEVGDSLASYSIAAERIQGMGI